MENMQMIQNLFFSFFGRGGSKWLPSHLTTSNSHNFNKSFTTVFI